MDIAKTLKEEIDKRGLKYTFVSQKTGIPYVSLSQYINGKREIPESKLRCILLSLGIDLNIFGLGELNLNQETA